ncbi:MAG: VOC family protein [Alphaproteobacteria bacterium]
MAFALNQIGQIAINVASADRAEKFYGETLGLRKLFRFGGIVFYDCGVRLMLSQVQPAEKVPPGSPIYFKVADIALARRELGSRGVTFVDDIHLVSPMEDHDLWMTFFKDPDEHMLALMSEMPKGYKPV